MALGIESNCGFGARGRLWHCDRGDQGLVARCSTVALVTEGDCAFGDRGRPWLCGTWLDRGVDYQVRPWHWGSRATVASGLEGDDRDVDDQG